MLSDALKAILAFGRVPSLLSRYNLWKYLFISGFISLAIGGLIIWSAFTFSDDLGNVLFSWYKWDWGSSVIDSISQWLSGFMIIAGSFFLYKYLVLIIVSPIMSPLSESLENKLIGSNDPGEGIQFGRFFYEMIRGIRINLRNIIRELFFTVVIFIGSFIPGLAIVTAPLYLFYKRIMRVLGIWITTSNANSM